MMHHWYYAKYTGYFVFNLFCFLSNTHICGDCLINLSGIICHIPVCATKHMTESFLCFHVFSSSDKQIHQLYTGNHYLFFILEKQLVYQRSHCDFFLKTIYSTKSFYDFIMLFGILSTENALKLIDLWFNTIEFSDTHYYVACSHFVLFYLCEMIRLAESLALHIEVPIRCYPEVWFSIDDLPRCSLLLLIFVTFMP